MKAFAHLVPTEEKMEKGRKAISAFSAYRAAKAAGNEEEAAVSSQVLKDNVAYFGYGYIKDVNELVPNVPLTFYMFRVMVMLGGYFILRKEEAFLFCAHCCFGFSFKLE